MEKMCFEVFFFLFQETEDLVAALFHRTADTNRFLRADSNAALDAMADSLSPGRAISVIVYKGCR